MSRAIRKAPACVVPFFPVITPPTEARLPTLDFSDASVRQRYRGVDLDTFLAIATHNRYAVHCIYHPVDRLLCLAGRQLQVMVMDGKVTKIWSA